MTARRLAKGMLAAAATALWATLVVTIDPHAEVICDAAPHLTMTIGLTFAGVAFAIGTAPGRSDPAGKSLR